MLPGRALVLLGVIWLGGLLAARQWPQFLIPWYGAGAALLGLAVLEYWQLRHMPRLMVRRLVPPRLTLNRNTEVQLRISNTSQWRLQVKAKDHYLGQGEYESTMPSLMIPAGSTSELRYILRPTETGEQHFGSIVLYEYLPLSLWQRKEIKPAVERIQVFPVLATPKALSQASLDPAEPAFPAAELRWNPPQLLFYLDARPDMQQQINGISCYNHCLAALMQLTMAAVRQGEWVGMFTAHGQYLPPQGGGPAIKAVYDYVQRLPVQTHATNYDGILANLLAKLNRQSLLIFITAMPIEQRRELLRKVGILSRHHHIWVIGSNDLPSGRGGCLVRRYSNRIVDLAVQPDFLAESLVRYYKEFQRYHDQRI